MDGVGLADGSGPPVIVAVVMHRKLRERLPGLGTPLIVYVGTDPLLDPHLLRKMMGRLDCCLSLDTIPLHFPLSDVVLLCLFGKVTFTGETESFRRRK